MYAAVIHHEFCMVYTQNVTSEATVRQWCRMFVCGQRSIHVEGQNGWLSVVSDDFA
jgi:succinate dehydrogenase/fumarate reductase-like Fe-S protein